MMVAGFSSELLEGFRLFDSGRNVSFLAEQLISVYYHIFHWKIYATLDTHDFDFLLHPQRCYFYLWHTCLASLGFTRQYVSGQSSIG